MFSQDVYSFITNNKITEIRGGSITKTFSPVWIVEVDNRLFARSWGENDGNWYTEISKTGRGQLKIGGTIVDVRGEKIDKNEPIHLKINQAYLKKYTDKEDSMDAEGITKPEYCNYTMEFLYDSRISGK